MRVHLCLVGWLSSLLVVSQQSTGVESYGTESDRGCPETDFVSCITRLRLRRVPFDRNMLNVVFNVTSEAKLRHTCVAYTDVIPCFRDKVLRCGNDNQRRMLEEVTKTVRFFCSDSSKERQKMFLKHVQCIGQLLNTPSTTTCNWQSLPERSALESCRLNCANKKEFVCMMRVWVSEQNLCTHQDVLKTCGTEASDFYKELQVNIFSDRFPLVCDAESPLDNRTVVVGMSSMTTEPSRVPPQVTFDPSDPPAIPGWAIEPALISAGNQQSPDPALAITLSGAENGQRSAGALTDVVQPEVGSTRQRWRPWYLGGNTYEEPHEITDQSKKSENIEFDPAMTFSGDPHALNDFVPPSGSNNAEKFTVSLLTVICGLFVVLF